MTSNKFYMFWHLCAILTQSSRTKKYKSNTLWEFDASHELNCILLDAFAGVLIVRLCMVWVTKCDVTDQLLIKYSRSKTLILPALYETSDTWWRLLISKMLFCTKSASYLSGPTEHIYEAGLSTIFLAVFHYYCFFIAHHISKQTNTKKIIKSSSQPLSWISTRLTGYF